MTKCNRKSLSFSSLGRQKITANFDGGRLTSDAGALLLREADRQLGLTAGLAECIADPRDPAKITHDLKTLLGQRIFGIALGYEDLNDHATLRDDPLFAILAEQRPDPDAPLGAPSTRCRFENAITRGSLARMAEVFVEQFIASHKCPPKELTLDFDPTDDRVHGHQVGRFYHGYYDGYCFLPLYVFCGDQLLCAYLRPAKIDGAKHSRAILELIVKRFRRAWPKVRIIFPGDSGFCRWKLLRWCDPHDVGTVVGVAPNPVLQRLTEPFMNQTTKTYDESGVKQRRFHEVTYAAQTWDRQRRIMVKAEVLPKGPKVRFVVTNLTEDPETIYDERYTARGDMENRIQEQQLGLFADRTSGHQFQANPFRLLPASAAYILIEHLRRVGLAGTELAKAQVTTIRIELFKIAARVTVSVRRIVLYLSSYSPYQSLFALLVRRLTPI